MIRLIEPALREKIIILVFFVVIISLLANPVRGGAVTISASGDQSYYRGEEITFSGVNTETGTTCFFIVGPNLSPSGAQITSYNPTQTAVIDGAAATFKTVSVKDDNTWSWRWMTANVALDPGTYTIYAVSHPRNKNNLAGVIYGTVSIIIKKPFIEASLSQSTLPQGDTLYINGFAEGGPTKGVQIWTLGKDYAELKIIPVGQDGSFKYRIPPETTAKFQSGQYYVVVQHPMQDDQFDIVKNGNFVQNTKLGAGNENVFPLFSQGSLQGYDTAEALVQALNDPNVDDTYTKLTFLVESQVTLITTTQEETVTVISQPSTTKFPTVNEPKHDSDTLWKGNILIYLVLLVFAFLFGMLLYDTYCKKKK
jgi:hypothetical protein